VETDRRPLTRIRTVKCEKNWASNSNLLIRFIIPVVFMYIKCRKWGPSKTQLSWFCIYCGDSDDMFRPCLAIFRLQCWRYTQMRTATKRSRWTLYTYCIYVNPMYIQLCFFSSFVYNVNLWPEDGQAQPKHFVTIAAINTKPRQLCFWRILLPTLTIYSI
jgi:hypothetical protein